VPSENPDVYHVLAPVDVDEERAAAQAETLLSLPGDPADLSVTVLHVYEEIDVPGGEGGAAFVDDLNESLDELREVPASVTRLERRLDEAGVAHERRELVGDPADGVARVAAELDPDSIVLGMRERSPVGKAVFGSVSQEIILDADRPVVVAR